MPSPHRWVRPRSTPKSSLLVRWHRRDNCTVKVRDLGVSVHRSSGRNRIKGPWEGLIPALEWLWLCQGRKLTQVRVCWVNMSITESRRDAYEHFETPRDVRASLSHVPSRTAGAERARLHPRRRRVAGSGAGTVEGLPLFPSRATTRSRNIINVQFSRGQSAGLRPPNEGLLGERRADVNLFCFFVVNCVSVNNVWMTRCPGNAGRPAGGHTHGLTQ